MKKRFNDLPEAAYNRLTGLANAKLAYMWRIVFNIQPKYHCSYGSARVARDVIDFTQRN